jgi:hypothetical protein
MENRDPRLAELVEIARSADARMSFAVDANTAVSGGIPIPQGSVNATASPGANGPLGQTSVPVAVGTVLGVAAVGLLGLGILFRRGGQKMPPVRIDAVNALNVYFSWLLIDGTLKLVAYHFHGHKLAQQYLLIA